MAQGATKRRIQQCVAHWPYVALNGWNTGQLADTAKDLGLFGVELAPVADFPLLKSKGLICPLAIIDYGEGGPAPFVPGWSNKSEWDRVEAATKPVIDACQTHGFPNVIAFTGYRDRTEPDAFRDTVEGLKRIAPYAKKAGVKLCFEMLNTRDASTPMTGHPGYCGDSIEWCLQVLDAVGSDAVTLLFDFYHVQIMDGDLLRWFRKCLPRIGHIHVAGNPGRNELDAPGQEIAYDRVMEEVLSSGYSGYVGQEFIPTADRDLIEGLAASVRICDA